MDQFNVPEKWRIQVEHAALKKARDAWRNWKHVLYKKYLSEGKDPIPAYPQLHRQTGQNSKGSGQLQSLLRRVSSNQNFIRITYTPTVWVWQDTTA